MPSKKRNETTLRLTDDPSELHAIITAGDSQGVEHERVGGDDASKPLYLKRV